MGVHLTKKSYIDPLKNLWVATHIESFGRWTAEETYFFQTKIEADSKIEEFKLQFSAVDVEEFTGTIPEISAQSIEDSFKDI